MNAPKWADLVDQEEHVAPPFFNSKLIPKAREFMPKSLISKKDKSDQLMPMLLIWMMIVLMRTGKILCWTYALIKSPGMETSHLGIK